MLPVPADAFSVDPAFPEPHPIFGPTRRKPKKFSKMVGISAVITVSYIRGSIMSSAGKRTSSSSLGIISIRRTSRMR
jgi:hypothetical protein